jgi:putative SOS response-associated peptidase YedK
MPVMVKPDDFDHWLLNDKQSETYKNILSNSCDEIKVDYYPVSMAVNSTKNDSVSLIERA